VCSTLRDVLPLLKNNAVFLHEPPLIAGNSLDMLPEQKDFRRRVISSTKPSASQKWKGSGDIGEAPTGLAPGAQSQGEPSIFWLPSQTLQRNPGKAQSDCSAPSTRHSVQVEAFRRDRVWDGWRKQKPSEQPLRDLRILGQARPWLINTFHPQEAHHAAGTRCVFVESTNA
jgi:hypothetical protein